MIGQNILKELDWWQHSHSNYTDNKYMKNMTRIEMIYKLGQINYNVIWPEADWNDLGFTETPIWINGIGYGYFMSDEPNIFYKAIRIPDEKWKDIRIKLSKEILSFEDVQGTSLSKMCFCESEEYFSCHRLKNLLNLPAKMDEYYYCGETVDGDPLFFSSEEDFLRFIERTEADVTWHELDDDSLLIWCKRIFDGKHDQGFSGYTQIDLEDI